MRNRKITAVLCAALMTATAVPADGRTLFYFGNDVNVAAADQNYNGFEYTILDDAATIKGYTGSDKEIVIPSEINGYPVRTIGLYAFKECICAEKL